MKKISPIEKIEAKEQKEMMYAKAEGRCFFCGKHLTWNEAQCAHCIPKGYAEVYGHIVINHPLNLRITCAGACNDKANLTFAAHPVEAKALVDEINIILKENI